ncbi:MAG: hypothetical protein Q7J24_06340 [Desulfomicrobium sp.]|nr:hypothetical protein [Desulfomicrobium sp.]
MAAPVPTIREIELTLKASGLTRTQARRALHYMKEAHILDSILVPQVEPKRGIINKLKKALLGK